MQALFEIAQGLLMLFFTFVAPILAGGWVLRPLDQAARTMRAGTRFTLLDFFGLFFLVQMPMALIHAFVPRSETGIYWTMMILGWVASVLVWITAVKTFSQAGIDAAKTRGVLVFFVMPMAFFSPFAVTVMAYVIALPYNAVEVRLASAAASAVLVAGVITAGIVTRRVAAPIIARMGSPFADDLI